MGRVLRDGSGTALVVASLAVLFRAVSELRGHDYLACMVLAAMGWSLLRAGVELLRPSLGE